MRRRLQILMIWLAALAGAATIVAHARFTTDMSAFLPRSPTARQRVLVDMLRDGPLSRLLMVGVEGTPTETLAALSRDMATTLRGDPLIVKVQDGDRYAMQDYGRYLWSNRYLLNPDVTPDRFTADNLHVALETDLARLGSQSGIAVKESLPADPTGELMGLVARMIPAVRIATKDDVWFSPDGSRAIMQVDTKAAGFDIDAQQAVVGDIQAALAAAKDRVPGSSSARVVISGAGMFAIHGRDTMKADTSRFSTLASLLVAAILLLAYRRPAMLVLAFLPVASGILAGIAAVAAVFGTVHGITLGFGVTLIGEAVDYAIYYFTYAGERRALSRLWPTLILGMSISVAGFAAMLFSSFAGFAQLGLFTVAGLIAALSVTRFVLPVFPAKPLGRSAHLAGWPLERLARLDAWSTPVIVMVVVGALVLLGVRNGSIWENSMTSLSPADPADVALHKSLQHDFGMPDSRYLAVITAPDPEQALQQAEALIPTLDGLVASGILNDYQSPTSLLASVAAQRVRQAALPAPDRLKVDLAEAMQGLPFKPGLFDPFLADVERARTASPVELKDLAGSVDLQVRSMLNQTADGWTIVMPLHTASDITDWPEPLAAHVVDLTAMSAGLLGGYRHEAMQLALFGTVAIVALLGIALRSIRRVATVIAPLAAAVIVTAGLLVAVQHVLGLFNLFGLLLTVAVGSNYCLFFERRGNGGEDRPFAALALANLCTVIGFGVLAFSGIPVLRGIGGTVALGAALSLVFGAVLIRPREAAA